MSNASESPIPQALLAMPRRVLYHHRTQGKAVEGVHIRGITDALRAEGVKVDIISLPGADPYASPKAMSPTQQARWWMKWVTRLPEPMFELVELGYNLISAYRVFAYLLKNKDVDLIYERYALFMFAPLLVARMRGVTMILEVNDSATVYRVRPLYFQRIAMMIERWVFSKAKGLVFVSSIFRDRALSKLGVMAPSIITPNAANIDKFSYSAEQRSQSRKNLGMEDSVVCGYLGAFVPWHAIDAFVYKIADYLPTAPHLKLLLVGDGATFPAVKAFVDEKGLSNQVVLSGRVSHDAVPNLLAAMDMAILPNAGDYTSPVKLFEFMACAVPAIAPDFSPIQEVLTEGETGWMFKAGDLGAAVQAVIDHSKNVEQLRAVGTAARAYIAKERQWRNNIIQLLQFKAELETRKKS